MSLANNHTNNNGVIGLEETKNILKEANISWAGGPYLNDFKNVGFVSGQNMDLAIIAVYAVLELDVPDIMPLIKELKTDNYKIMVFAHFGDEYQKIHNQLQENLAHLWIENGADIIVGTHPHVIQDTEVYLGKPIIYSLGNFVFDQNWSKATREGVLLSGEFTKDGLYLSALPTMAVNSKPTLIQGDEKVIILGKFYTPWAGYLTEQDSDFDFFFPN